ncbi:MAG: methyltransferase domain-containing protein [Acidobacteria bacterium]|nr:methyltransferase domain-containing protein [Acidobacteriota bacterium]
MLRLLKSYPRTRPELPAAYRAIYVEHYRKNRTSTGLLQRAVLGLEAWMHRRVAARATEGGSILEIGAGTLNHVPYERGCAGYVVVEPFRELWQDSPHQETVDRIHASLTDVPDSSRFDRILSVAVLEHLESLPEIVARCGLLLKSGGIFQAGIPSEGGLLWGMSWRCTTAISFYLTRRLRYEYIMRHEHLNNAREIEAVLRHFFRGVKVDRFPGPSLHSSFYTYLEAADPNLERCRAYLGRPD